MRRFTALFRALDRTTRTTAKVEALRTYFAEAPPEDAAWALAVLTGRRGRRPVSTTDLRAWVAAFSGHDPWMVEECYDVVGDLAETLALLLPDPDPGAVPPPPPLHEVMDRWVLPLRELPADEQQARLAQAWRVLELDERFLFHKLLTGGFRVGVGRSLVTRGLAAATGMDPAILAHRLTGRWNPDADTYRRLTSPDAALPDPGRPYPFMLAHPLEADPEAAGLGDPAAWLVEWKWDGIRAQLLHRDGEVLLWSRGEEVITPAFPEVAEAGGALPAGTVLDGELLAWKGSAPLPFSALQRRLGRKRPGTRLLAEVPGAFLAYDLLEAEGTDLRDLPLRIRRERLATLLAELGASPIPVSGPGPGPGPMPILRLGEHPLLLAPPLEIRDWAEASRYREDARARGVEGLMIKAAEAPYVGGRPRGAWWKWKVEPWTLDVVLLYARKGHGRRAGVFTDFTFGVRDGAGGFVPVTSAYTGLTDAEFREVDRWIRRHVLERFGPVRSVEPALVFEIAFEGIRASTRHKSGVALRFPRMKRWRKDLTPGDADSLETVQALLAAREGGS